MSNFWRNEIKEGYYDKILINGLDQNKGIQANWHNITFQKVKSYLKEGTKHLDYACGSGSLIGIYSEASSVGYDISKKQITYAQEKYGNKGNFYTIDELNYENYIDNYDVVTLLGLLEFLDFDENLEVINSLYKIIKPNGILIVTTPNFTSTMFLLDKIKNLFGGVSYKNQYKSKFNKKTLETLLKESRFNEYSINKFINFPVFLSFFNMNFALKCNNFIETIIGKKMGYLFFITLRK